MNVRALILALVMTSLVSPLALGDELGIGRSEPGMTTTQPAPAPTIEAETESEELDLLAYFLSLFE